MSSILSNGFDSPVEKPSPRWVSRQRLSDSGTVISDADGGWSLIDSLIRNSQTNSDSKQSNDIYPLPKRSSSTLSEKSLEICTENLGCETGSDSSCSSYSHSSSSSSESETSCKSPASERSKTRKVFGTKRVNSRVFPPPLTSITGDDCVHVKPHRENGRLVIKAVTAPSSHACFQAEREGGRLRLRFLNKFSVSSEEEDGEEGEQEEMRGSLEMGEGVSENGGGEMGINNLCRCKEGGNQGLLVWEPFWVASS